MTFSSGAENRHRHGRWSKYQPNDRHRANRGWIFAGLSRHVQLSPSIRILLLDGSWLDISVRLSGHLQGYGLFISEEERYRPDGKMLTTGMGTYRVPRLHDIPQKFNVSLLKGRGNPRAVYSSKVKGFYILQTIR